MRTFSQLRLLNISHPHHIPKHLFTNSSINKPIQKCDAIVIGAGIAGTSTAYELSKAGLKHIIILEQEYAPGYHSTGRAAGLYSENYGTKAVRILSSYSRAFFDQPPAECVVSDEPILTKGGELSVTQPGNEETLLRCMGPAAAEDQSYYGQLSRRNVKVIKGKSRILALHPLLESSDLSDTAVYEAGATGLNIGLVSSSYLRGCKKRNVQLLCNMTVDSLHKTLDRWEVVANDGRDRFEADLVVNASGAWADEMAALAGMTPAGVQPRRRCIVTFEPTTDYSKQIMKQHISDEQVLPWLVGVNDIGTEFWYLAPQMKSGLFLSSPANTDEDEPCDAQITDFEVALCVDRINTYTKETIQRIHSMWAGHRCYSRDGNPIIGSDASDASFVWVAALAGQGVQSCAGYSKLCASLVLGNGVPQELIDSGLDVEELLPGRFV